jgi:hypothetical protein
MNTKACAIAIGLALIATGMSGTVKADEANSIVQQVTQAIQSKDAKRVIEAQPVIEKLWPQKPDAYFASVKDAAAALDAAATPSTRGAISNLFSSMIEKTIPSAPESAIPCLEAKDDAILYFLNFREVREDQTNLLALARYVGTIRGQIIPNFVPRTVYVNPPGLMDATPAQAQQIIQENQQNIAYNNWQQSLAEANTILTFHLLHNVARVADKRPENVGFVKDLSTVARLSQDEQSQLQ